MTEEKDSLIGRILVEKKIITQKELDTALREQQKSGGPLGPLLIKLGLVTEEEFLPILSEQLNLPYIRIKDIRISPSVIEKVPAKFACHYKLIPVKAEDEALTIAVTNPLDVHAMDDLRLLLGADITPVLAGEKDILEGIRKYYGVGAGTIEEMMGEVPLGMELETTAVTTAEETEELAEDASIIKFVNQLLTQAVQDRATDIHIEPYEDELRVRFRIDGVLYETSIPPTIKHFQSAIISRIKIMANLDIAERRLPQDGRMKLKLSGNDLDVRVSILPTSFGESVDIRLLSRSMLFNLEELGLWKNDLEILEMLIRRPHGIILVTGPTGSGKTTTLYACLNKINDAEKKIITIEDPIEYQLKGITQIQIHPKIGLTFAHGLRSMLRHDPDIMMVGEVRDFETAEITIRLALTGHLVFSTLHTNDAAGAITRLLDMGIEPFLVSSSLECAIAQRLVRLICPRCKRQFEPEREILEEIGTHANSQAITIYEGRGCEACKFTGYKGRTAIYEFLVVNNEIRDLILSRTSANKIKEKAISLGMKTLRQDGWEKVLKGFTTASEVLRVTQEEEAV